MKIVRRAANELPTVVAGVAAVLYIFGVQVPDDVLAQVTEQAEGLLAFAIWVYTRSQVDGPVTRKAKKNHDELTAPQFVNFP